MSDYCDFSDAKSDRDVQRISEVLRRVINERDKLREDIVCYRAYLDLAIETIEWIAAGSADPFVWAKCRRTLKRIKSK